MRAGILGGEQREKLRGTAGKPLSGTISIADPGATYLSISITGAPLGMSFSMSGLTITAYWPQPVAGSYALKVVALVPVSAGAAASAAASPAVR